MTHCIKINSAVLPLLLPHFHSVDNSNIKTLTFCTRGKSALSLFINEL